MIAVGAASRKGVEGVLEVIEALKKDPGLKKSLKAYVKAMDEADQATQDVGKERKKLESAARRAETALNALNARSAALDTREAEIEAAGSGLEGRESAIRGKEHDLAMRRKAFNAEKNRSDRAQKARDADLDEREAKIDAFNKAAEKKAAQADAAQASVAEAAEREAEKARKIAEIQAG